MGELLRRIKQKHGEKDTISARGWIAAVVRSCTLAQSADQAEADTSNAAKLCGTYRRATKLLLWQSAASGASHTVMVITGPGLVRDDSCLGWSCACLD
jgi:hypothetical protein